LLGHPGDFEPDFSELSLQITKDLEQKEFGGDMPADDYIEASAIIYMMLKSTGKWDPEIWETSRKMMAKVKKDKDLTSMNFADYIKSTAIYYKTFVSSEANAK
jgi:hypothetical protein